MQFWPFIAAPIVAGLATAVAIAFFVRQARPDAEGISPHHRRNEATDLLNAKHD